MGEARTANRHDRHERCPAGQLPCVADQPRRADSWGLCVTTVELLSSEHQLALTEAGLKIGGGPALIGVRYDGEKCTLTIAQGDVVTPVTLPLRQPASGEPIYIGDFPGDDDKWPDWFTGKHAGFTGEVRVREFRGGRD